jgi:phosphatidylglycerol:prolipoprotein diacylglycerol transferase
VLPVIVTLPGLDWDVQSYGLLLALALVLGWVVTLSLGRRDRLPPGPLGTAYVLGAGLGLVGARIGWLLQRSVDASGAAPELFVLRPDELAPFAGVVVATLVAGLHLMRRRVPVVAFLDVVAPAAAAGAILERLGALLAGTGFGDYAPGVPWAIRFPAGSPAWLEHQRALAGLLPPGAEQSLPVHPTQLYAMAVAGAALGVGLWLRRRRRFSGQVFLGTAIAYLLGRALVEEWSRADAGAAMLGPLTSVQVGALVLAAGLGAVLWARGRLAALRPGTLREWEGGRWSPQPERAPQRGRTAKGVGGGAAKGVGGGKAGGDRVAGGAAVAGAKRHDEPRRSKKPKKHRKGRR